MIKFRKIENIKDLKKKINNRPETVNFFTSNYIYRPISIYFTYIFLSLSISANTVTLLSIFSSIIGAGILLLAEVSLLPIGYFFFWFFYLLDFSDGDIARYNSSNSLTGHFLELLAHYIVNTLFFLSSGYAFFSLTGNAIFLLLSVIGLIGDILIKIKNPLIWQVVVVEYLRLNQRMAERSNFAYNVDTNSRNNKVDAAIKKTVSNKQKIINFFKKYIFLGHYTANAIFIPFLLASIFANYVHLNIITYLFAYTCLINIILGLKLVRDVIKHKKMKKLIMIYLKIKMI